MGLLGLVTLVIGTFLPWLRSGTAERNSYRAGHALHDLLHVSGLATAGLDVWPYVGVWCAAVAGAFAFGLHRTAAIGGLLVAGGASAVSIGALRSHGNAFISGDATGPSVTMFGAFLIMVAATVLLLPGRAVPAEQEQR
jgi:hypothetical protein